MFGHTDLNQDGQAQTCSARLLPTSAHLGDEGQEGFHGHLGGCHDKGLANRLQRLFQFLFRVDLRVMGSGVAVRAIISGLADR